MLEKPESIIPINILPSRVDLPTLEADILHILGNIGSHPFGKTKKRNGSSPIFNIQWNLFHKKNVNYYLDQYYKGIKISPYILYRLQSAQTKYDIPTDLWHKNLRIMGGKLIITELTKNNDDKDNRRTIKSCIDNPLKLEKSDQEPKDRKYLKYNGGDYFILSFTRKSTDKNPQEDLVLISYKHKEGLMEKEKIHIENMPNRTIGFEIINGDPKIKIDLNFHNNTIKIN